MKPVLYRLVQPNTSPAQINNDTDLNTDFSKLLLASINTNNNYKNYHNNNTETDQYRQLLFPYQVAANETVPKSSPKFLYIFLVFQWTTLLFF